MLDAMDEPILFASGTVSMKHLELTTYASCYEVSLAGPG